MNLAEKAFCELYPGKEVKWEFSIKYSGKFKAYNANVRMRSGNVSFNLSKSWRGVSKEIQLGLIQELLVRLTKDKAHTPNMDLYNMFIKKASLSAPKIHNDSFLEDSFNRVNDKYFFGMIDRPNLKWHDSSRRLGTYEYASDTISMSRLLKDSELDVLDYIMYHEMLHKKHKFRSKNGRNFHHTTQFRDDERAFENQAEIERKLKYLGPRRKIRKKKGSIFRSLLFP